MQPYLTTWETKPQCAPSGQPTLTHQVICIGLLQEQAPPPKELKATGCRSLLPTCCTKESRERHQNTAPLLLLCKFNFYLWEADSGPDEMFDLSRKEWMDLQEHPSLLFPVLGVHRTGLMQKVVMEYERTEVFFYICAQEYNLRGLLRWVTRAPGYSHER